MANEDAQLQWSAAICWPEKCLTRVNTWSGMESYTSANAVNVVTELTNSGFPLNLISAMAPGLMQCNTSVQ